MKQTARLFKHDEIPVLIDNRTAVSLNVIQTAARYALPAARLDQSGLDRLGLRVRPCVLGGELGQYRRQNGEQDRVRAELVVFLDPEGWLSVTSGAAMYLMDLPKRLGERYGMSAPCIFLFSQVEYLTFILAHEARHLWQDLVSPRPWTRGEYDADDAAMRALMRLRAELGPASGIGKPYVRRRLMDQPNHLRKAS